VTIKPRKIPCRPRVAPLIQGAAFFFVCGVILAWSASTENRGIRLLGFVTLSPQKASIFYWLLAAMSFVFVLVGLFVCFAGIRSSVFLELASHAIVIPRELGGKRFRRIPYREIMRISELNVAGTKSLGIQTIQGLYWVSASVLPGTEDYEMLKQLLASISSENLSACSDISLPPT
jgi:hypothetical protein